MKRARLASTLLALASMACLTFGCASAAQKREEATYGPTESVLEVLSVLRQHVPDDTYRFEVGRDFSGRNVYRASLLRLENIERIHAESLRGGQYDDVIAFGKGRALERLGAYDLAAEHFERAALREGRLQEEARRAATINSRLAEAIQIGPRMQDPLAALDEEEAPSEADALSPETLVAGLDERIAALTELYEDPAHGIADQGDHYRAVIRQEIERADVTRARYFVARRHVLADGQVRAVGELQRVIQRHRPSGRYRQHVLALADLYAALAEEYVAAIPPESLNFDPPRFEELVDAAAQLYEAIASEDGTPEKLAAARRLEAFIAFTLQVDRDRFTR